MRVALVCAPETASLTGAVLRGALLAARLWLELNECGGAPNAMLACLARLVHGHAASGSHFRSRPLKLQANWLNLAQMG